MSMNNRGSLYSVLTDTFSGCFGFVRGTLSGFRGYTDRDEAIFGRETNEGVQIDEAKYAAHRDSGAKQLIEKVK